MQYKTGIPNFTLREAEERDIELIFDFIHRLAEYEKMADQVEATPESLREALFRRKQAEVLIGEEKGEPVAFALFFHNFSTFKGRAGLYLEDLFVRRESRGKGYGLAIFQTLAAIALQRGCGRMDWCCLDWNTPSINFYKQLGAQSMDDWTLFHLHIPEIKKLAAGQQKP